MASSGHPASLDRFDTVGLTGREDIEEVEQMNVNLPRLMTTEGPENSGSEHDEVNSERGSVQATTEVTDPEDHVVYPELTAMFETMIRQLPKGSRPQSLNGVFMDGSPLQFSRPPSRAGVDAVLATLYAFKPMDLSDLEHRLRLSRAESMRSRVEDVEFVRLPDYDDLGPQPEGVGLIDEEKGQLQVRHDEELGFRLHPDNSRPFSVNGQLLPDFDAGTIARLGLGLRLGLEVAVFLTAGKFSQPAMRIQGLIRQGLIRQGLQYDSFLDIIIPLATMLDAVTITDALVDDQVALEALYAFEPMDLSDLEHKASKKASKPTFSTVLPDDLSVLAAAIAQASDTKDVLDSLRVPANPYAEYLTDTRDGNYKDLTFLGHTSERPDRPVPATTIFHTGEHRTVTLLAGAANELRRMHDQRAKVLLDTPKPAVFIKGPFSNWSPRPDDLQEYGITADGTLTHHWVAMYIDDDISNAHSDSVQADDGKRVKKNKATRARELAMPPTAKSNANREFVAAFEQLDGSNDSVVADEQEG
ncbi:hypothetical protein FDECE_14727 [Fusarium decemcellulare]|nr:hypothetical protein FDECE_14727 [Fusarium decemcellulare]